jgi:hypothetical protein
MSSQTGPAASAAPETTPSTVHCLGQTITLASSLPLGVADPITVATSNQIAQLPVHGLAPRLITQIFTYRNASDYLSTSSILQSQIPARAAAFARDGFRGGVAVGFLSGPDHYGIFVLRFASGAGADDYFNVHLQDICAQSVSVASINGLHGVAYLRTDNLAKATFVVGDTEVQLDICSCVQVSDRVKLASHWARLVNAQLAAKTY